MKPQIAWITPDPFVDCDNNSDILSNILKHYDIHWIVLLHKEKSRFQESDFEELKQLKGLAIEFLYNNCRARSPKMLQYFHSIFRKVKSQNSDIIYFNFVPTSPYILPLYWRLNKNKTVFTAHDGSVKPSFKIPWLSKVIFKLAFGTIKQVNMFSPTQAELFHNSFPKVKQYIIPLALKDFGSSLLPKRSDNIVFFFFGSIHSDKNIGLFIDAACKLYEKGVRGFKISINGVCPNWSIYEEHIKYPELFEVNVRKILNAEIPDLFAQSHYMVFPYREMSQSGAIKVAFNYNVPVIVSDLKGFTDEVEDGVNGFIFKSEDVDSLCDVMKTCIMNHNQSYGTLCSKMKKYTEQHYSVQTISKKYIEMFNSVQNN